MVQETFDSGKLVHCCLVGDGFVGKTCLAKSLLKMALPTSYEATLFDNFAGNLFLNNKQYIINVFDTAGQQDYTGIRAFAYQGSDVITVCFSMADRETFQNVQEFWIPEIRRSLGYKKPVILVGTQTDCITENAQVKSEEGHNLAKEIGAIHFLECSAYDKSSVFKVFENIVTVTSKVNKRRGSLVRKFLKKLTQT